MRVLRRLSIFQQLCAYAAERPAHKFRLQSISKSLVLALCLSACGQSPPATEPPGPPPMPPYQMRAEAPPGERTQPGRDGRALFSNLCGSCHLPAGMGTNVITQQMLAAKRPPAQALLENRTDLEADYVAAVVRHGKGAMPPLSRVDVTDAELQSIAAHLDRTPR